MAEVTRASALELDVQWLAAVLPSPDQLEVLTDGDPAAALLGAAMTGLGLIGFLIGTYMLIVATWRAWTTWDTNPEFAGTYVLVVHVWMTSIMSTGVLGWMGFEVALFLCIVTNLDLVRQRARATVMRPMPVRWPSLLVRPEEQQVH